MSSVTSRAVQLPAAADAANFRGFPTDHPSPAALGNEKFPSSPPPTRPPTAEGSNGVTLSRPLPTYLAPTVDPTLPWASWSLTFGPRTFFRFADSNVEDEYIRCYLVNRDLTIVQMTCFCVASLFIPIFSYTTLRCVLCSTVRIVLCLAILLGGGACTAACVVLRRQLRQCRSHAEAVRNARNHEWVLNIFLCFMSGYGTAIAALPIFQDQQGLLAAIGVVIIALSTFATRCIVHTFHIVLHAVLFGSLIHPEGFRISDMVINVSATVVLYALTTIWREVRDRTFFANAAQQARWVHAADRQLASWEAIACRLIPESILCSAALRKPLLWGGPRPERMRASRQICVGIIVIRPLSSFTQLTGGRVDFNDQTVGAARGNNAPPANVQPTVVSRETLLHLAYSSHRTLDTLELFSVTCHGDLFIATSSPWNGHRPRRQLDAGTNSNSAAAPLRSANACRLDTMHPVSDFLPGRRESAPHRATPPTPENDQPLCVEDDRLISQAQRGAVFNAGFAYDGAHAALPVLSMTLWCKLIGDAAAKLKCTSQSSVQWLRDATMWCGRSTGDAQIDSRSTQLGIELARHALLPNPGRYVAPVVLSYPAGKRFKREISTLRQSVSKWNGHLALRTTSLYGGADDGMSMAALSDGPVGERSSSSKSMSLRKRTGGGSGAASGSTSSSGRRRARPPLAFLPVDFDGLHRIPDAAWRNVAHAVTATAMLSSSSVRACQERFSPMRGGNTAVSPPMIFARDGVTPVTSRRHHSITPPRTDGDGPTTLASPPPQVTAESRKRNVHDTRRGPSIRRVAGGTNATASSSLRGRSSSAGGDSVVSNTFDEFSEFSRTSSRSGSSQRGTSPDELGAFHPSAPPPQRPLLRSDCHQTRIPGFLFRGEFDVGAAVDLLCKAHWRLKPKASSPMMDLSSYARPEPRRSQRSRRSAGNHADARADTGSSSTSSSSASRPISPSPPRPPGRAVVTVEPESATGVETSAQAPLPVGERIERTFATWIAVSFREKYLRLTGGSQLQSTATAGMITTATQATPTFALPNHGNGFFGADAFHRQWSHISSFVYDRLRSRCNRRRQPLANPSPLGTSSSTKAGRKEESMMNSVVCRFAKLCACALTWIPRRFATDQLEESFRSSVKFDAAKGSLITAVVIAISSWTGMDNEQWFLSPTVIAIEQTAIILAVIALLSLFCRPSRNFRVKNSVIDGLAVVLPWAVFQAAQTARLRWVNLLGISIGILSVSQLTLRCSSLEVVAFLFALTCPGSIYSGTYFFLPYVQHRMPIAVSLAVAIAVAIYVCAACVLMVNEHRWRRLFLSRLVFGIGHRALDRQQYLLAELVRLRLPLGGVTEVAQDALVETQQEAGMASEAAGAVVALSARPHSVQRAARAAALRRRKDLFAARGITVREITVSRAVVIALDVQIRCAQGGSSADHAHTRRPPFPSTASSLPPFCAAVDALERRMARLSRYIPTAHPVGRIGDYFLVLISSKLESNYLLTDAPVVPPPPGDTPRRPDGHAAPAKIHSKSLLGIEPYLLRSSDPVRANMTPTHVQEVLPLSYTTAAECATREREKARKAAQGGDTPAHAIVSNHMMQRTGATATADDANSELGPPLGYAKHHPQEYQTLASAGRWALDAWMFTSRLLHSRSRLERSVCAHENDDDDGVRDPMEPDLPELIDSGAVVVRAALHVGLWWGAVVVGVKHASCKAFGTALDTCCTLLRTAQNPVAADYGRRMAPETRRRLRDVAAARERHPACFAIGSSSYMKLLLPSLAHVNATIKLRATGGSILSSGRAAPLPPLAAPTPVVMTTTTLPFVSAMGSVNTTPVASSIVPAPDSSPLASISMILEPSSPLDPHHHPIRGSASSSSFREMETMDSPMNDATFVNAGGSLSSDNGFLSRGTSAVLGQRYASSRLPPLTLGGGGTAGQQASDAATLEARFADTSLYLHHSYDDAMEKVHRALKRTHQFIHNQSAGGSPTRSSPERKKLTFDTSSVDRSGTVVSASAVGSTIGKTFTIGGRQGSSYTASGEQSSSSSSHEVDSGILLADVLHFFPSASLNASLGPPPFKASGPPSTQLVANVTATPRRPLRPSPPSLPTLVAPWAENVYVGFVL